MEALDPEALNKTDELLRTGGAEDWELLSQMTFRLPDPEGLEHVAAGVWVHDKAIEIMDADRARNTYRAYDEKYGAADAAVYRDGYYKRQCIQPLPKRFFTGTQIKYGRGNAHHNDLPSYQGEQLYWVKVNDYTMPPVISSYSEYYGPRNMILSLLLNECAESGGTGRWLDTAMEYFSGKGPGLASIALEEESPMIRPVEWLGEAIFEAADVDKELSTVYYTDKVTIDRLTARLVYIRNWNGTLQRCVQAEAEGMRQSSFRQMGLMEEIDRTDGGFPGFIVKGRHSLRNSVLYADRDFDSMEELLADREHPAFPDLDEFYRQIHGDG